MSKRGFSLVELLVGLVLVGIVTGSIYQVLITNSRMYRQQTQRVDLNADLRAATALLPSELREVSATDTAQSDIIAMSANAITFKAMRTLNLVCVEPGPIVGASGTIVTWDALRFGVRELDPSRDSIVIFAEADTTTRGDNYWIHANVSGVTREYDCPGGAASMTIALTGISPVDALADVRMGAPARGFEVEQVLSYADANGDIWLGLRHHRKASSWQATQPLLGPLAASGLQFTYQDSTGAVTATPAEVYSIGLTVIGSTDEPVFASDGTLRRLVDTLTTRIAVRNNARY